MSDHQQGTELNSLMATGIPASSTQGTGLNQAPLIEDLDDDIEKTSSVVHTPAPQILVSAATPSPDLAADIADKKPGFFGKVKRFLKIQLQKPVLFWSKTDKRTMLTASSCFLTVMMLCAMISLAVVAVHGSKAAATVSMARAAQLFHGPDRVIHTINVQQRDRFSTDLSGDSKILLPLTSAIGDTCDDESGSMAVQTSSISMANNTMFNVTSTSTTMMQSTSIMPVSVEILTQPHPSVSTFIASLPIVPAATSSMSASTPTLSTTQTCLEYGDGAGPCARPYGRPNSTPESWISSLAAESLEDASTLPVGTKSTALPVGIPAMASSNAFTSSFTDASLSSLMDSATNSPSLCEPTATVYVTITAGLEPSNGNMTVLGGDGGGTVFATSTSLSLLTITWSGSDGPLTTTETAFWGGATGTTAGQTIVAINGTGGLTTLHVPSYTLTLQNTVAANGTVFSSAGPTALGPIVSSAGKKPAAPKPLGMGGSVSGNGVYCVVMLIMLIALLV